MSEHTFFRFVDQIVKLSDVQSVSLKCRQITLVLKDREITNIFGSDVEARNTFDRVWHILSKQ